MRIKYLPNADDPITTTEDFARRRLESSRDRDWKAFDRNMPHILISCCPFCGQEAWMQAGLMFSLTDNFWFRAYSNGRDDVVDKECVCSHLFCVDGALHLNGHTPVEAQKWYPKEVTYLGEAWDYVWVASEVPFVKPRVMGLPGMRAVMTDFRVDGKYSAYPIVYFTKDLTHPDYRRDFCIPWATKFFVAGQGGYCINGEREDTQDYDLLAWLDRDRLFWLDAQPRSHRLLKGTAETFPYLHLTGRQHPYKIVAGEVIDLPRRDRPTKPHVTISD